MPVLGTDNDRVGTGSMQGLGKGGPTSMVPASAWFFADLIARNSSLHRRIAPRTHRPSPPCSSLLHHRVRVLDPGVDPTQPPVEVQRNGPEGDTGAVEAEAAKLGREPHGRQPRPWPEKCRAEPDFVERLGRRHQRHGVGGRRSRRIAIGVSEARSGAAPTRADGGRRPGTASGTTSRPWLSSSARVERGQPMASSLRLRIRPPHRLGNLDVAPAVLLMGGAGRLGGPYEESFRAAPALEGRPTC